MVRRRARPGRSKEADLGGSSQIAERSLTPPYGGPSTVVPVVRSRSSSVCPSKVTYISGRWLALRHPSPSEGARGARTESTGRR